MLKLIRKINNKITHVHAISACAMTLLAALVLGFLAPHFPIFSRETLAYASGWLVEGAFGILLYVVINDWQIFDSITGYMLLIGNLLLVLMYGLWLCFDFGSSYPFISAIGFNIGTIFRTTAMCILISIIFKQRYNK